MCNMLSPSGIFDGLHRRCVEGWVVSCGTGVQSVSNAEEVGWQPVSDESIWREHMLWHELEAYFARVVCQSFVFVYLHSHQKPTLVRVSHGHVRSAFTFTIPSILEQTSLHLSRQIHLHLLVMESTSKHEI